MKKIIDYYTEVCKAEGLKPLPIKFNRLSGGIACVSYNSKTFEPINIQIDLKKCSDVEYALLHETAHQILLLKSKDPAQRHNAKFRKIEAYLIDKYMYSPLSFKYKL